MDDMEALFGQLEDVFAAVDAENIVSLQDLETNELLRQYSALTQLVLDRRETLWPQSQEGRDAHSRRNAIQVELHRRDVL